MEKKPLICKGFSVFAFATGLEEKKSFSAAKSLQPVCIIPLYDVL